MKVTHALLAVVGTAILLASLGIFRYFNQLPGGTQIEYDYKFTCPEQKEVNGVVYDIDYCEIEAYAGCNPGVSCGTEKYCLGYYDENWEWHEIGKYKKGSASGWKTIKPNELAYILEENCVNTVYAEYYWFEVRYYGSVHQPTTTTTTTTTTTSTTTTTLPARVEITVTFIQAILSMIAKLLTLGFH